MSKRNVYFILAILGILLPYSLFLPWVLEHGLDVQLFFTELLANDVASTTALDFMMVSVTVIIFIIFESKKLGMKHMYVFILATLVAVGFGLALFLCSRERYYEKEHN
jgi:4-amino-4-deoxy-L-arabinose transferase-like glycosyltransferase